MVCSMWEGHTQEVCGMKWSTDGRFLASGGGDNAVKVWSHGSLTNTAAVGSLLDYCSFF